MLVLPWTGAVVSEADWHWAVGIWEGEGSVGVYDQTINAGRRMRLEVSSTDLDILTECATHFDLGRIATVTTRNCRHKQAWKLRESRRDVVSEWCRMVLPFIRASRRRFQVSQVLEWCDAAGPVGSRGVRRLKTYGRDHLAKNPEILGLTKGESYAIAGG